MLNMKFHERINGKEISVESALNFYKEYCNNRRIIVSSEVEDYIEKCEDLGVFSSVIDFFHYITDVENLEIFEEGKHFELDNSSKKFRLIKPITGITLREARRELFAQKVFANMVDYNISLMEYAQEHIKRNLAVYWVKELFILLRISEDFFVTGKNYSDIGIRIRKMTQQDKFWEKFQLKMDWIISFEMLQVMFPDYEPAEDTLALYEKHLDKIEQIFDYLLMSKVQRRYMMEIGEEVLYWNENIARKRKKIHELKLLMMC